MSKITVQSGLNYGSISTLANSLRIWTRNSFHVSSQITCSSCLAQLAWATGLARYTARAAENLRAQNLDYRCESVFRRDKLSDSAVLTTSTRVTSGLYTRTMGVASNLSVIRGNFQRTSAVGSMQFVRCPESRSVRSWEVSYTLAL